MKRAARLGVVAGLAIAAFLVATPAWLGEAQETGLTVSGPWIIGAPSWTFGVAGDAVNVTFTIANHGASPSAYLIEYHWVKGASTSWLRGSEATSTDAWPPLLPGETRQHDLEWRPIAGQVGSGAVEVIIVVGDGERIVNTQPIFVPAHDLQMTVASAPTEIGPFDSRFWSLNLHNRGNIEEEVAVNARLMTTPAYRQADVLVTVQDERVTVPAGASATTQVFIDYEFSGDSDPFALQMAVNASTARMAVLQRSSLETGSTAASQGGVARLERPDNETALVGPSGTLWPARLLNLGNNSDVFQVAVEETDGWRHRIKVPHGQWQESLRIGLNGSAEAQFLVYSTPPAGVAPGTPLDAVVAAQTRTVGGVGDTMFMPLRVAGPALEVVPRDGWHTRWYDGDRPTLGILVRNEGTDEAAAGGRLDLIHDATEQIVANLTLPALPPQHVWVGRIQLPEVTAAWAGNYRAEITPAGAFHTDGFLASLDVASQGGSLLAPQPQSGQPGERVSYRAAPFLFEFTNHGSRVETYDFTVGGAPGAIRLQSPDRATLGPGEAIQLAFDHWLPRPTDGASRLDYELTAAIKGRPDLSWTSESFTRVVDVAPPTVNVTVPEVWAAAVAVPLRAVIMDDDRVASAMVNVAGDGTNVTVPLVAVDDEAWAAVGLLLPAGKHVASVDAWDEQGNRQRSDDHAIRVEAPDALQLFIVPFSGEASAILETGVGAGRATIRFEVAGGVGARVLEAGILDAEGDVVWSRLVPVRAAATELTLPRMSPGQYNLTATLSDAAGTVRHDVIGFNVTAPRAAGAPMAEPAAEQATGAAPVTAVVAIAWAAAARRRARGHD